MLQYVLTTLMSVLCRLRDMVHVTDRHVMESPTGTFIVLFTLDDSSDFGLLGEQSSPKWEISYLGC